MKHNLKIKQEYAEAYFQGKKGWELRKNDRDFKVGDTICFTIIETSLQYQRVITYLFEVEEYGLPEGYCIMSLEGYKYDANFAPKDTFRRSAIERKAYKEGREKGFYEGKTEGLNSGRHQAFKSSILDYLEYIPAEDQRDIASFIIHHKLKK